MIHETNTFSPIPTRQDDFEVIDGEQILEKLAVTPLFKEAGVRIVPTLYAIALPSGKVEKKTFLSFRDTILQIISRESPLDGVWLYLHGAMEVEEVGSGETNLISELRKIIGGKVPIALALDFHANMTERLVEETNVICGYRTAPHIDQAETQIRAGELLLKCIRNGLLPSPVMVRPPVITPGNMLVTTIEPGKSLIRELEATDAKEGIFFASLFGGQPWVDAPNMGPSAVVAGEKNDGLALREARRLARLFWEVREKFHYEEESAEPEEAVERAINASEDLVFISDSGDNTTAGAPGDNTYLLKILMAKGAKNTLVAGITDPEVVRILYELNPGEKVDLTLGGRLDPQKSESVKVTGMLKRKSRIIGWAGEDAGRSVVIGTDGIDILVTERRCGVISPEIIKSAGVDAGDYRIIVVKLGYLFDALRKISKRAIIALTPGASCEAIEKMEFRNIRRPVYPLDRDFEWNMDV